ncbi:MAG: hypothetical protein H7Y20_06595 [Bryobacteraceae bacterium]|nr:hypothetical protein [Bryobacteraceae bacterium]
MPIRSLVLQALILSYSLAAGAFNSNPPSIANEPEGVARLGIAVAAGLLGVVVRRHRDGRQNERSANSLTVDLMVIYGLVVLSQVLLNFLRPEMALPRWSPTQGGFVGFMMLAATRALFAAPATAADSSSEWDDGRIKELINEQNRYRRVYGIAASLAVAIGLLGLFIGTLRIQIASALIVIGSAYLLEGTLFNTAMTTTSTEQQSLPCIAILQGASAWYYLALFPASIVALSGSKIYLYWVPLVVLVFAETNHRAAESLNSNCGAKRPDFDERRERIT